MNQTSAFARRLLIEGALAYICTTDTRNIPHLVPVFFLFDPVRCHAYFLFSKDSKKDRNLRSRPYVSFVVDVRDYINPLENKGVMIQGHAKVTQFDESVLDIIHVRELFEEKYGWSPSGNYFQYHHDERLVDVAVTKISCWRGPTFYSCPRFCVATSRRYCARMSRLDRGIA